MKDKLSNIKELQPLLIGGKYISNLEKDVIRDYIEKKLNYIERLNNIMKECSDIILKELDENHHLSYGPALSINYKLTNYEALKEGIKDEQ